MIKFNDSDIVSFDDIRELEQMEGIEVQDCGMSGRNPNWRWFIASDGEREIALYVDTRDSDEEL